MLLATAVDERSNDAKLGVEVSVKVVVGANRLEFAPRVSNDAHAFFVVEMCNDMDDCSLLGLRRPCTVDDVFFLPRRRRESCVERRPEGMGVGAHPSNGACREA